MADPRAALFADQHAFLHTAERNTLPHVDTTRLFDAHRCAYVDAFAHQHAAAQRYADTFADGQPHARRHTDRNRNAHADRDGHSGHYPNGIPYVYCHLHAERYTDGHRHIG